MKFDVMPDEEGLCIAIRGHSKFGKTHMANMVAGVDNSVIADTHATNSTIETLRKIGQTKFRKVGEWGELLKMTDDFIREYNPPMAFIFDSGSDMVDMAQLFYKEKYGKQAGSFQWAEVWGYIRNWMNTITSRGFDLILTSSMKRVYTSSDDDSFGSWTGEWEPKEWKDLDYQLSVGIWLERGMRLHGKVWFDYRIFPAVKTKDGLTMSRWARLGECKQYITGPFTRESIKEQVRLPWYGTKIDILNEYWLQLKDSDQPNDQIFVRDIEAFFKGNKYNLDKNWIPPVGKPYERPAIPIVDVSGGPAAALAEAKKAVIDNNSEDQTPLGNEPPEEKTQPLAEVTALAHEAKRDEPVEPDNEPEDTNNETSKDENEPDEWVV